MDGLDSALREWRGRLSPADVGLTTNAPRHVRGLRREELAVLAGISIEYVVRLEQGRATTPSVQVCLALARALQLSDHEQAYLMAMAGHPTGPDRVSRLIPASVYRIIERLADHPLAVYDATWQLLHWNPLFAATFGDPTVSSADQRNVLIQHFESGLPGIRFTAAERTAFEESLVADLRSTSSRYARDSGVHTLISRLRRNARFEQIWASRSVAEHHSGHKIVEHPEVGDIDLDSDTLTTHGTNLHVVVYTPHPGTDAQGKLDLLATVGLQHLG